MCPIFQEFFLDMIPILREQHLGAVGATLRAGDQRSPSHLFASYGVPRVVNDLHDSQELIYRYLCGPGKAGLGALAAGNQFGFRNI